MKKGAFKSRLIITLIAILFLMVSSAVFVNYTLQTIASSLVEEAKPDQRLVDIKALLLDVSNAEGGVKSYGLTRDEDYLKKYNEAVKQIETRLAALHESAKDEKPYLKKIARIDRLISKKLDILDKLLIVENQQSVETVIDNVKETVTEATVENIIADMEYEELMEKRRKEKQQEAEQSKKDEKFFKRVFGNGKKDKENTTNSNSDDFDVDAFIQSTDNYSTHYERIDTELSRLEVKEKEKEIELKIKELKLIQEHKEVMDEINIVFSELEEMERQKMVAQIEKADNDGHFTGMVIAAFCVLSCLLLLAAGYIVYTYFTQNEKYKSELVVAHKETERQNKDILDSINYAKRIQTSMLPDTQKINKFLANSFVFYQPKDIVAGDFYWMDELNGSSYIAVADSTGHGVPGALVSMVCASALDRCIKEFGLTTPASILDRARELIIAAFDQNEFRVYDGMDIALCCIDYQSKKIQYAGANNSLLIVNNEQLKEIKADKQPVARFEGQTPFKNHEFSIEEGDKFYLFTDGFSDQFGGPKGKKFMYGRFKKTLVKYANLPFAEQKTKLKEELNNWQGNYSQVDDICIVGFSA